jgi:tripartite-type tricarboxylate transporter receptor subunit TctC
MVTKFQRAKGYGNNLILVLSIGALSVSSYGPVSYAQDSSRDYPVRAVRVITPNAPGSSIDTLGRIISVRLSDTLGQAFTIDNRAGASGALGMEIVKNAPADGYTVAIASASSMSIAPLVQKAIPYDPVNDFTLVTLFAVMPNVLIVNPSLPIRSVTELVGYARANPGKVNMASAGPGAASHLGGVLLMTMASFDSLHVPYKGGGPSVAAIVAGESHWSITPAPAAMAMVKAGRVRAIGHTLDKRAAIFGDMPTVTETVPGYDYSGWAGLVAPKGLANGVIERLRTGLAKVLVIPQVRDGLAAQGAEVVSMGPDEFRRYLERDVANTQQIMRTAKLQRE